MDERGDEQREGLGELSSIESLLGSSRGRNGCQAKQVTSFKPRNQSCGGRLWFYFNSFLLPNVSFETETEVREIFLG